MPVLRNQDTVICAISSPQGPDNFYTQLQQALDHEGRPLALCIALEMVCQQCKLDPETMYECRHMDHLRPHWHSDEKNERLKLLMAHRKGDLARELLGVSVGDDTRKFLPQHLDWLFDKHHFLDIEGKTADVALISADPSGGGTSDLAFSCAARFGASWAVISLFVSFFLSLSLSLSFPLSLLAISCFPSLSLSSLSTPPSHHPHHPPTPPPGRHHCLL